MSIDRYIYTLYMIDIKTIRRGYVYVVRVCVYVGNGGRKVDVGGWILCHDTWYLVLALALIVSSMHIFPDGRWRGGGILLGDLGLGFPLAYGQMYHGSALSDRCVGVVVVVG